MVEDKRERAKSSGFIRFLRVAVFTSRVRKERKIKVKIKINLRQATRGALGIMVGRDANGLENDAGLGKLSSV